MNYNYNHVRAHAPFTYRKIELREDSAPVVYGSMRDHLPYVIESRHGQTYMYCATEEGAKRKVEELNLLAAYKVMTDE